MEIKDFSFNRGHTVEYKFIDLQDKLMPDFLIEAGAYEASFSNIVSERLDIKAVAFEANHIAFDFFKNDVHENVEYLNMAVSDNEKDVHLYIEKHNDVLPRQNTSILQPFKETSLEFIPTKVRATSIDSFFENSKYSFNRASLWIDVEGANDQVLMGAIDTLQKTVAILIETENLDTWQEHHIKWNTEKVYSFLKQHGFEVLEFEEVYKNQRNTIFLRKEEIENYKTY